jgi:hypothetical protein
MKTKIKTMIELEGSEQNIKEICRMLRWSEYCGNIGHSTSFKFSVDGDGAGQVKVDFKDFTEEQKEALTKEIKTHNKEKGDYKGFGIN